MAKLKRLLIYVLAFTMIITSAVVVPSGFNQTKAYAAGTIKLSTTTLNLAKGKSSTLKLNNASGKVKWSSSNSKIAKVNKSGKVTAKKIGKATITAKCNGKSYKCKVFVTDKKLTVNTKKVNLSINGTKKIKATLKLSATIYYKIENPDIVKCEWSFKWKKDTTTLTITGLKPGDTRVLVYSKGRYTAIPVHVKAPWENVEVIIPDTIGEQGYEDNRMKITNYQFFDPGTKYYNIKIDFKSVKVGHPGKNNWGEYFYCYDKNGNLLTKIFLYADNIKLNKTYTDTAMIPNETAKIEFIEYPEAETEPDQPEEPEQPNEPEEPEQPKDPEKWTKADLTNLKKYTEKATEYAESAYNSAKRGTTYEKIAQQYISRCNEQLAKAAELLGSKKPILADDGSDYLTQSMYLDTIAKCDCIVSGNYSSSLILDISNVKVDLARYNFCIANLFKQLGW